MNDYGEIIKLPYEINDIYEPLKKLLKYDKIKPMILQKEDGETKTFDLTAKRNLLFNEKVSIRITELEKGITEVKVYSKSKFFVPFDFGKNKRNVKIIINKILKELSNCENVSDDFSIEVMKTYKFSKGFLHFIISVILFYYPLSWLMSLMHITTNIATDARIAGTIFFSLIITIIYKILRLIKRMRYKHKRMKRIKSMLYDLIEGKAKNENNISKSKNTINAIKNNQFQKIKSKATPYLKTSVDYIKKIKKEKPKVFWTGTIAISGVFLWSIFGGLSNILKDPCAFNVEMGGYEVTGIDWCRTDLIMDSNRLPEGFNVESKDFVYCKYDTTSTSNGWSEGYVYKACAIKKGWKS